MISVRLPSPSLWQQSLSVFGPIEGILIFLAFILAYLYMRMGVVAPMQRLTKVADTLSTGKDVQVDVRNIRQSTRNEMDRLVLSVNRLRASLQIAIRKMREAVGKNSRG